VERRLFALLAGHRRSPGGGAANTTPAARRGLFRLRALAPVFGLGQLTTSSR
jgi:hypothetical protein